MSSTTDSSIQGYLLLIAAAEEAARAGHAAVDVEHLFLGLLVSGGTSTPLLTATGIDLAAARRAVRELQRLDLGSLGISFEVPVGPDRDRFGDGTEDLPLTEPARRAVRRQSTKHTDAAVLEALLVDQRGAVRRLLEHMGVDAETVRERAAQAAVRRTGAERTRRAGGRTAEDGGRWSGRSTTRTAGR